MVITASATLALLFATNPAAPLTIQALACILDLMSTTPGQFKNDSHEPLARLGKTVSAPKQLGQPQRNRGEQASRLELGSLDGRARSQNPTTEVKS